MHQINISEAMASRVNEPKGLAITSGISIWCIRNYELMKVLLFSAWAWNGYAGNAICQHVRAACDGATSVDLLTKAVGTKDVKTIKRLSGVTINKSVYNFNSKFFDEITRHAVDWEDVYQKMDVECLKDYDRIVVIGNIDRHNDGWTRTGKISGVFPKTKSGIRFASASQVINLVLAILKANNKYQIPIHEIAFDPQELSFDLFHEDYKVVNHTLYHGYDMPGYNIHRLDSMQAHLSNSANPFNQFVEQEKKYDFVFGYSSYPHSGRDRMDPEIKAISEKAERSILIVDKSENDDSLLPRDEYLDKIKKSRFTLVIPSYDNSMISIYRFIESIALDCLPMLYHECNIEPLAKSFGVDLTPIVFKDDFPSEEERLKLLSFYKEKFTTYEKKLKFT